MSRLPRLALAVLPGLDHFVPDLVRALRSDSRVEPRLFAVRDRSEIAAMLAWTDQPDVDSVWFDFCWPPFPAIIAATEFSGRRVVVRVHRIEAYGTDHVANADWSHVTDVVVVGRDMAERVREAAPEIELMCRLQVIHNGLDLDRFVPAADFHRHRIGWCGWFSLHKNPLLALQILHRLRQEDTRYSLHISSKGGEAVAVDSFRFLSSRLDLREAVHIDGAVGPDAMPAWHAQNGVLLSTSVYESFGYAIAEAAAAGCDLAMLDNCAAGEFWPEATRYGTLDEAVAIIRAARPHRWRSLVQEKFSLARQVDGIVKLLVRASPAEAGSDRRPHFDSAAYWEQRYERGGNSGSGSSGRLAGFKAEVLNAFVRTHDVDSIIEFGCGDGGQLGLAHYPAYIGVDVSATAVARCRARFAADASKRFVRSNEAAGLRADMALSMDVLFHLVEDDVFDAYMHNLFAAGRRYVVIYASDCDSATTDVHVRHRAFSLWIAEHAVGWRRAQLIRNRYPFDLSRPSETSFADFHIFERAPETVLQNAGSGAAPWPAFHAA